MSSDRKPKQPEVSSPTYVTIFGGGVTGLTAAHELVERGFRVQVWEPVCDDRFPQRGCDVGGLARTQWSRAHWPEVVEATNEPVPRVGRRPYELRELTLDREEEAKGLVENPLIAVGPWRGYTHDEHWPERWEEADVFRHLAGDVQLESAGDPSRPVEITVLVREVIPYDKDGKPVREQSPLKNLIRPFIAATKRYGWKGKEVESDATAPPHAVVYEVELKDERRLRFVFLPRIEREHRNIALHHRRRPDGPVLSVKTRYEFYYRPGWGVRTQPIVSLPQRLFFKFEKGTGKLAGDPIGCGIVGETDAKKVCKEVMDTIGRSPGIEHVYVEVYEPEWSIGWNKPRVDLGRDSAAAQWLVEQFSAGASTRWESEDAVAWAFGRFDSDWERVDLACEFGGRLVDFTAVRLDQRPPGTPTEPDVVVLTFRVRERWFAGEHGYRFFPAFYHHLFDTMRRTPLLSDVGRSYTDMSQERAMGVNARSTQYAESGRSAFDNLVERPATIEGSAAKAEPSVLKRRRPQSFAEVRDVLRIVLTPREDGGLGLNDRDGQRVFLASVKYMTSCKPRREKLEDTSWANYIDLHSFAPQAQELITTFPKALVAMEAEESDTRTMGSVGTQLMLDQICDRGTRDSALDGPTSVVWLDHFRRYLEAQGVEFVHGELVSLQYLEAEKRIWPEVRCYEPRYFELDAKTATAPLLPGYFILALPGMEVGRIARKFADTWKDEAREHGDLLVAAELGRDVNENVVNPGGDFRHYAGAQFYFWEDLHWIDGHTYYPDSPWAITTVSQARRWVDRPDWEHGYRGVLSVILGRFDRPGLCGKTAWECSPEEIGMELWAQIRKGLNSGKRLPRPVFWHFDENFRWEEPTSKEEKGRWVNSHLYNIQVPGGQHRRPGDLSNERGYSTRYGVVLAGTYAKTHTRITSMEAANESARHAVNAILRDAEAIRPAIPCDIFPIEDREYPDLEWARKLDEKLHERGLPHMFDILDLDHLMKDLLRGGDEDPLNPRVFMERVLDALSSRAAPAGRRSRAQEDIR